MAKIYYNDNGTWKVVDISGGGSGGGGSIDADTLNGLLKAGDSISIGKTTAGDKVEVKLDQSKDIKIIGGSSNNVYFTSDSSAFYGMSEGSIYTSFGDQNGISKILHKDPGGLITYIFPSSAYGEHTVLTNKNVKTLFGNKSIVGSGNIDLYQHRIKFESVVDGTVTSVWLTVISSKNLKVDSLTDLKTLLGNKFEYSATGYSVNESIGDVYHVCAITQSGLSCQYGLNTTSISYPAGTWTDTVTTI